MRHGRILRAALVACALLACGDGVGPGPGTLVVAVTTPHTDDGGILLTVRGPGVDDVSVTNASHVLYWRLVAEHEVRILVLGDYASGPLVTLRVPDGRRASEYTGSVIDVTDRNSAIRADPDQYQIAVEPGTQ